MGCKRFWRYRFSLCPQQEKQINNNSSYARPMWEIAVLTGTRFTNNFFCIRIFINYRHYNTSTEWHSSRTIRCKLYYVASQYYQRLKLHYSMNFASLKSNEVQCSVQEIIWTKGSGSTWKEINNLHTIHILFFDSVSLSNHLIAHLEAATYTKKLAILSLV